MSNLREAWLCVLQDADGNEETELITIERGREGPPVIEVTNGVRRYRRDSRRSLTCGFFTPRGVDPASFRATTYIGVDKADQVRTVREGGTRR